MSSSTSSPSLTRPRAIRARIDGGRLSVDLEDGREVSVPLVWFDWLARASAADRRDFRIVEGGAGIWWDRLNEGVSVPSILGQPEFP